MDDLLKRWKMPEQEFPEGMEAAIRHARALNEVTPEHVERNSGLEADLDCVSPDDSDREPERGHAETHEDRQVGPLPT
jgi:hypothetical protein